MIEITDSRGHGAVVPDAGAPPFPELGGVGFFSSLTSSLLHEAWQGRDRAMSQPSFAVAQPVP
ncbi:MAG: hypothetical protein WBX20_13690, partial [Terrimicrobiaceae bacterium]